MPNSRSSVFNLQSLDTQSAPLSLMSPMQPTRSVVMSILDSTSWIRHPPAKHCSQFRNDGVQPMGRRKLVRVAFHKARLGGARRLRLLICSRRTCRISCVHHALTRDNAIPEFLQLLNPQQRSAVMHGDAPLLIIAGAGTGKTTTLAHRVAWQIVSGITVPSVCNCL